MRYDGQLNRVTPDDVARALEVLNAVDAFDPDADDGAADLDVQIAELIRDVRYAAVMDERAKREADERALT